MSSGPVCSLKIEITEYSNGKSMAKVRAEFRGRILATVSAFGVTNSQALYAAIATLPDNLQAPVINAITPEKERGGDLLSGLEAEFGE